MKLNRTVLKEVEEFSSYLGNENNTHFQALCGKF